MGIKIDEVHSNTKKLDVNYNTFPMLAPVRNNLEAIPGRAGALDYGMEFGERTFLFNCSIRPQPTTAQLVEVTGAISEWLNPYKGLQRLIFDDLPDRYWEARLVSGIDIERIVRSGGAFNLEFVAPDPFAYAVEDDIFKTSGFTNNSEAAIIIMDLGAGRYEFAPAKGNMKTEPLLIIQGTLTTANHVIMTFNNDEVVRINGPLNSSEEFVLDTRLMTAKVQDKITKETVRNGLGQMENLTFPEMLPGQNEVKVEVVGGTLDGILIKTRSRWL